MSSYKVPIIVVVIALVAVTAGFAASKMASGEKQADPKDHLVDPVALEGPFTVNLADKDYLHYVKLGVAVQLGPMTEENFHYYEAGGLDAGGHGGGSIPTGPQRVASFHPFKDAVIRTASAFTSDELLTASGRERLRTSMQKAIQDSQADWTAKMKKAPEDHPHNPADPPYDVDRVYFTELAVQ